MSKISNMNDIRNPVVKINDSLNKYTGKTHFPKKYAFICEFIARAGMPDEYYQSLNPIDFNEDEMTPSQGELLSCYDFTPSGEQMVKLNFFLEQYFPNKTLRPNVVINNEIDPKTHFSKKVAQAKEILARSGMPEEYYQTHVPIIYKEKELTPLQVELLRFYAITPSEEQMIKLKAFLKELLPNKIEELQSI